MGFVFASILLVCAFLIVALRSLMLRDNNKQCLLISVFCRVFYQDLLIPLRMQHSEKEPQQEICHKAKDETGDWVGGEEEE